MRCPRCSHVDDRVVDSRQSRDGDSIRRRRECLSCGARFTTYETTELALPLVVKSDDRREPFERGKIRRALRMACQKRPIDAAQIDGVVDRVEKRVSSLGLREVDSRAIGDVVIEELRDLDGVAYLRFASVYYSFEDINEFVAAIERVRSEER